MGVSALNITLKYYEGGVKLKVKSRNCPGHCKAPKQRDKMEIPSDLSIKKLAFASTLIPFSACSLFICDNLCCQGCGSTCLDLDGINCHRYHIQSGKEFYLIGK